MAWRVLSCTGSCAGRLACVVKQFALLRAEGRPNRQAQAKAQLEAHQADS